MYGINPINMRLYRRFDADLIALQRCGIPVNTLAEVLLEAYAEGKRIVIIPEGCVPFNIENEKSIHLTVEVRTKEAAGVIAQVKYGFRNQFCKALVRDALQAGAMWVYLDNQEAVDQENARLQNLQNQNIVVLPYGLKKGEYRKLLNGEPIKQRKTPEKQKDKLTPNRDRIIAADETRNEPVDKEKLNKLLDDIEGWGMSTPDPAQERTQEKTHEKTEEKPKQNGEQTLIYKNKKKNNPEENNQQNNRYSQKNEGNKSQNSEQNNQKNNRKNKPWENKNKIQHNTKREEKKHEPAGSPEENNEDLNDLMYDFDNLF